jgi:hypothetical protein
MTKRILFYIVGLVFIVSCSNKERTKKNNTSFTSYELSFTDGWSTRFSFSVDSSRFFLGTYKFDTLRYGVLPDSIFEMVDKNAFNLLTDKSVPNTNIKCYDCPSISILVNSNQDTVRLLQKGQVSDTLFFGLVDVLSNFLASKNNGSWKVIPFPQLLFETLQPIMPPLPPPIREAGQNKIQKKR